MNWLCWHVGTVTDPKLGRIADSCKTPRANVIAVWAVILESAKDRRGAYTIDPEDVAYVLGIEPQTVIDIHEMMIERGLVDGAAVCKWGDRQHGTSAERMRRKRDAKPESVTHGDAHAVTVTPTVHNNTDSTVQTEKKIKEPASRKREPAIALPREWVVDDTDRAFAVRMGLTAAEIEREQTKFAAYWSDGKGGNTRRTPKAWRTTWHHWVTRVAERGLGSGQQHRTAGGNGFVELGRSFAEQGTLGGGRGLDEAA